MASLYNIFVAPLTVTLVCLLLANQHPSPVDDCPLLRRCHRLHIRHPWRNHKLLVFRALARPQRGPLHIQNANSPIAITTWMLFALLKLTTGILIILA
jgi:hypothetical protein